jgi:hypothetical protein
LVVNGYPSAAPGINIHQTHVAFAGNNLMASVLYSADSEGTQYWANGSLGTYTDSTGSTSGTISRDGVVITVVASWYSNPAIPAMGGSNTSIWIDNILSNTFSGAAIGVTTAPTSTTQIKSLFGSAAVTLQYSVPSGGYLKIEW